MKAFGYLNIFWRKHCVFECFSMFFTSKTHLPGSSQKGVGGIKFMAALSDVSHHWQHFFFKCRCCLSISNQVVVSNIFYFHPYVGT